MRLIRFVLQRNLRFNVHTELNRAALYGNRYIRVSLYIGIAVRHSKLV